MGVLLLERAFLPQTTADRAPAKAALSTGADARRALGRAIHPEDEFGKARQLLSDGLAGRLVDDLTCGFVNLGVDECHDDLRLVEHGRVEEHQHLPQMILRAGAPERTRRRRLNGHRLIEERLLGDPRYPVDGILEHPRDRVVVLRGHEDDAVGSANSIAERQHRRRKAVFLLEVKIV